MYIVHLYQSYIVNTSFLLQLFPASYVIFGDLDIMCWLRKLLVKKRVGLHVL